MDWGLLQGRAASPGLRRSLLYPNAWPYYLAILLDIALRCTWSSKVLFVGMDSVSSELVKAVVEVVEVARRCMWNMLRVEWELVQRGSGGEGGLLSKSISA
jgi:hypothetical protein